MSLNDYIFQKPIIQTERLILRPLVESDEVALREWLADKSIYKYWGKSAGKTDKDPSLLFKKEARPTSCNSTVAGVSRQRAGYRSRNGHDEILLYTY